MKIIRWLLRHSFLILLIVAVIYGYMFWGNLVGEDTPAGKAISYLSNEFEGVSEFVSATKSKQEKLSQQNSSESGLSEAEPSKAESSDAHEAIPEDDVMAEIEPVSSGTETQLTETQAAEKVVEKSVEKNKFTAPVDGSRRADNAAIEITSESKSENIQENGNVESQVSISHNQNQGHNNTRVKQNTAGVIETTAEPFEDVVATNAQSRSVESNTQATINAVHEETFVSAKIEKQLDNVDRHGRVINPSQQADGIRASWIAARKSFYQRDYVLSEKMYQDVIDNTEDSYDAYGELGNVYLYQRKKEQAAAAYYEAATILVRKGQAIRARSLVGLLHSLDKSKADKLQKLIDDSYQL